ncbi:MAG: hypothetical protein HGA53_07215, partial [Anaerolineaceae bacterium]|nr:hypothetical protein [Anaerolineaceae bacterium]
EETYTTTFSTPENCCQQEETKTPTKPPVTPTDPPVVTEETQVTRGTLAPPVVEGGPVLIPVTGDDQSTAPMGSIAFGSLFSNLGMMFLGFGLVLTAINKKLHL